jgi:tripartite ATP-independent transporter DctM subunit
MTLIVILVLAVLLLFGTPLAYATGAVVILLYFLLDLERHLALAPQLVFSQLDVFALMAMPLFILVGEIMNRARVTHALVDFAMALVGRLRGGLGHVNVMTSVFFAGISGSAMADSAALGNTLVPAMRQCGYPATYAGAITAASSIIGPIIPPSIILIFYGAIMGVDVAALFAAGIGPGLLLAAALMAANAFFARRCGHPGGTPAVPSANAFAKALPALALPSVIVLGIVFGVMTPTEAAAVAVIAAVAAGAWYGNVDRSMLRLSLMRTVELTGAIFLLFAIASLVIHLAALTNLPAALAEQIVALDMSGATYLLMVMVAFLVFGMFLDTLLGLALVAPVLVPVAVEQGADPVHVGVCVCLTLAMGLISPPLGGAVMVVSAVTRVNYWSLFRWVIPFFLVELLVLLAVVLIPELTLALPRALGL